MQEPFGEYDEKYSGQPQIVLEEDIQGGLRPTIPETCLPAYRGAL